MWPQRRLLDFSFGPDPEPDPTYPKSTPCSCHVVGNDIAIVQPTKAASLPSPTDVIESITAYAKAHLKKKEKVKWTQASSTNRPLN